MRPALGHFYHKLIIIDDLEPNINTSLKLLALDEIQFQKTYVEAHDVSIRVDDGFYDACVGAGELLEFVADGVGGRCGRDVGE